ncbi:MAG: hypothetical protein ACYCTV_00330 [Leptospirales bacterium]
MVGDEETDIPFHDPATASGVLTLLFEKGSPETVLEDGGLDHEVSDCLISLFEAESLSSLLKIPSMTPDWSLYVRKFLENYSEEAEVETGLLLPGIDGAHYLYGFGILVDGLESPLKQVGQESLAEINNILKMLFSSGHEDQLSIRLHPDWAGIPDLYLFSYDERRAFLETQFGEDMEEIPGELGAGSWQWDVLPFLGKSHPVLSTFPAPSINGVGRVAPLALVGAISSRVPPGEGSIQERIERFPDDAKFQESLREIARILRGTDAFSEEDVSVSIVPWSYLLPMSISLATVQSIIGFLEGIRLKGKETLDLVPFWENQFLWLHASIRGGGETEEFLLIDEYVWEFVSELVPALLDNHLPMRTKWHALPGDGREYSLGLF